jgi:hypothetical protein
MVKRVRPVAIKQGEHIRTEHAFAACLGDFEPSRPQQDNHKMLVLRLRDLRPAPLAQFVGGPDLGKRQKSQRRAPDVAGEGCLVADTDRAHAEFLVDELAPRASRILALGGVEMERCHGRLPLFTFQPVSRKEQRRQPFSERAASIVKPERPLPGAPFSYCQSARSDRSA